MVTVLVFFILGGGFVLGWLIIAVAFARWLNRQK